MVKIFFWVTCGIKNVLYITVQIISKMQQISNLREKMIWLAN